MTDELNLYLTDEDLAILEALDRRWQIIYSKGDIEDSDYMIWATERSGTNTGYSPKERVELDIFDYEHQSR